MALNSNWRIGGARGPIYAVPEGFKIFAMLVGARPELGQAQPGRRHTDEQWRR